TFTPGDFASSSGWTGYSMYHSMVDSSSHTESTSWSAGGSVWYGFWHAGASVSEQSSNYSSSFAIDDFRLSFEMSQVQIVRPWFSPEFMINRGWDLRKGEGWNFDQMPSDGGAPPAGLFVGYPLQAIFVRNVSITSAGFKQAYDAYSSQFSGSGSVGWGPITLSGSYGHSESGDHFHAEGDGATITVPGMQIIAFINHLFGKTPNLLPDIDASTLV
ncbi:MAG TPA: hypothetical protein VKU87_03395, partial [Thermomicrobiaceae bacterium]|nr:hypothetical protein [Thermomicrobiaceae bacterium]